MKNDTKRAKRAHDMETRRHASCWPRLRGHLGQRWATPPRALHGVHSPTHTNALTHSRTDARTHACKQSSLTHSHTHSPSHCGKNARTHQVRQASRHV